MGLKCRDLTSEMSCTLIPSKHGKINVNFKLLEVIFTYNDYYFTCKCTASHFDYMCISVFIGILNTILS